MKNLKMLLAAAALTSSAFATLTAVEIDSAEGSEMAGAVTGAINFNGEDNCKFSGSATGDVTMTGGNVQIASSSPFGGIAIMAGGSLEAITSAFTLPAVQFDNAGSKLINNQASNLITTAAITGSQAVTFHGTGAFMLGDASAASGIAACPNELQLDASSELPAAASSTITGDLVLKALPAGVTNDADVNCQVIDASGLAGSEVTAASLVSGTGKLYATKIDLGAKKWSHAVSVLVD